jgi:hypothetical protein
MDRPVRELRRPARPLREALASSAISMHWTPPMAAVTIQTRTDTLPISAAIGPTEMVTMSEPLTATRTAHHHEQVIGSRETAGTLVRCPRPQNSCSWTMPTSMLFSDHEHHQPDKGNAKASARYHHEWRSMPGHGLIQKADPN